MSTYEAPAKLNLSLLVSAAEATGMHPIESLVQTIEVVDLLKLSVADQDVFHSEDAELDPEDNLVVAAVEAVRRKGRVPSLNMRLEKSIPQQAGMGGGSADAAAALLGAIEAGSLNKSLAIELAPELGADVALFLEGGTQLMSGFGEHLETQRQLDDFAVAVVVPEFGLSTADVYRRWDELGGPEGDTLEEGPLPTALRGGMPLRNDLVPAALDLDPRLGDFMADVRAEWDAPVAMTGSGPACFGFFGDADEAADAAQAIPSTRAAFGADLRDHGVANKS